MQSSPVQGTGFELSPQGLPEDVPVGVPGVGGEAGKVGVLYVGEVGVAGVAGAEGVVGVVGVVVVGVHAAGQLIVYQWFLFWCIADLTD